MPAFPITRYLVPAVEPPPTDLTELTRSIAAGLPATIALTKDISLVLALPTGLATAWLDADPTAVVTRSDEELSPRDVLALPAEIGSVARAPIRLFVQYAGRTVSATPLVAGRRFALPLADVDGTGVLLELVVRSWEIHAGTLRGLGDFGSTITVAWREADRASDQFLTPVISPNIISRLKNGAQADSQLGYGAKRAPAGYVGTSSGSSVTNEDTSSQPDYTIDESDYDYYDYYGDYEVE